MGNGAQAVGNVCMWAAVLLRLPHILESRRQRELWLAGFAAAAATTLDLDGVRDVVDRTFGGLHSVDLVRNVCGLVSSFALLEVVHSLTADARRRARLRWLRGTACCVVAGVVVLDMMHRPHGGQLILEDSSPTPSTAYWLLIIATHMTANVLCVMVCLSRGRQCTNGFLKTALFLLGSGAAMAGLYWLGALSQLLGHAWSVPVQPFALALHGLLVAAALSVPSIHTARRALTDLRDWWLIWPLWRDLVEVCPQVLLSPRRSRLQEILCPQGPGRLLLYRKLMEIRDAILLLDKYVTPELHASAQAFADRSGRRTRGSAAVSSSAKDHSAAVLAVVLKGARAACLAAACPRRSTIPIARIGADTLPDETAFLVEVSRIYRTAPTPVHPHTPVTEETAQ
ncbi:MAB_1171c family putative transporter [Streptomyces sp. NPDC004629]|uniref:MAB_1171c family putative transporter n=1 Tax=Streptomyces sp. NPDC004629 TaxID=3364705 RepID=UPI0036A72DF5